MLLINFYSLNTYNYLCFIIPTMLLQSKPIIHCVVEDVFPEKGDALNIYMLIWAFTCFPNHV